MSDEVKMPEAEASAAAPVEKPVCGVVMPISAIDKCSEGHWLDVRAILFDVIDKAGFRPNLVSDSEAIGLILKDIVSNLYSNQIVVVDVSALNPNVMFELGMRLTFDQPTVIVKDDATKFSFDTSPIRHIEYPRDLRHGKIETFKQTLLKAIKATTEAKAKDPDYSVFLKHFGQFTVPTVSTREVTKEDYIIDEIRQLRSSLLSLRHSQHIYSESELATDYMMLQNLRTHRLLGAKMTREQKIEFLEGALTCHLESTGQDHSDENVARCILRLLKLYPSNFTDDVD